MFDQEKVGTMPRKCFSLVLADMARYNPGGKVIIVPYEGEQLTHEEIIEWYSDKMVIFKRPKTVVFADELPLSPGGKVMLAQVKEKYGHP